MKEKSSMRYTSIGYLTITILLVYSMYRLTICPSPIKEVCIELKRTPVVKNLVPKRVLVTGAAGFIGFHLARALNHNNLTTVVGIDNFNNYYDTRLKKERAHILHLEGVTVYHEDVCHREFLEALFSEAGGATGFTHVVHLAAQAGVRYSLDHPLEYVRSNLECQVVLLELLAKYPKIKLVYASSSSVYGKYSTIPFRIDQRTDTPGNMYAATKKTDELLGRYYCEAYGISAVGLRFFTVYGPWGRPDMATYKFADAMHKGNPVPMFHISETESLKRDFTYVDDIVEGIIMSMDYKPSKCGEKFNLGFGEAVSVPEMIEILGKEMKIIPNIKKLALPPTEILKTWADTTASRRLLNFDPKTNLREGIREFVKWFNEYETARIRSADNKKDDDVTKFYKLLNVERLNRDAKFENVKMLKHNQKLHKRLNQDRKIFQDWAAREGIYTPLLCDVNFLVNKTDLLSFKQVCTCPPHHKPVDRNCIPEYSKSLSQKLEAANLKETIAIKSAKKNKKLIKIEGYTSRGGEFMLFNKTHLKSNVSYYEDICRKSPICIGFTSEGFAKRKISEVGAWNKLKATMWIFDIDYCTLSGVACPLNSSCRRQAEAKYECTCDNGYRRVGKRCIKK